MNDKELEKILNFVLNNMGNKEMMRIVDLQKTAQIYYLKCEELKTENAKLRECVESFIDRYFDLPTDLRLHKGLKEGKDSLRARQVLKELENK